MKRSTERILTTHAGSLPRPQQLLSMIRAQERGEPVDEAALAEQTRLAVRSVVRDQVAAHVDLASDGEMSKPGYSTYVKDRLTGFCGEQRFPKVADLAAYPSYADRELGREALRELRTPACTGEVRYIGQAGVERDVRNLREALQGVAASDAFLTAASPGVISLFLANEYYPSHEAYLEALAEAMRHEYEAIHAAGFILQVDCPDLAMGRHIQFADLSIADFRKKAALHVEVLNHALRNIPADRMRMHLCWGNYEGPHHCDIELSEIVDIILGARPSAISFVAANPRHEHEWRIWQDVLLPDGKILIPGVIDSTNNFIEHPDLVAERIERFANAVGHENVIAGTDCGFSTFAGLTAVDPAIAWAKLATLAEGARRASARRYGRGLRAFTALTREALVGTSRSTWRA